MAWMLLSGDAQAQMRGGFGGGGGFGGYGSWWTGLPYGLVQSQNELPYYAKYPPVYYSHPVARTYGYSPFAYPPGFTTPDLEPAPQEIINPHAPQPSAVKPTSDQTATVGTSPVPKVVVNPFVDGGQLSFDR